MIKYSEITVEESRELEIDSKFYEWELDKIAKLKLDARYEEVNPGEVDELDRKLLFPKSELAGSILKLWLI